MMTYLEKLLELNRTTLKKANLLFAAKHKLEDEEEKPVQKPSRTIFLKERINALIYDYQEALNASKNMISFVSLNHISLKANYSAFLNG
jgi:hypothetical protein